MDAIECGIVKLPRVPVADNIPGDDMPMFRNLWEHIGKDMPKKGRGARRRARSAQACRPSCRRRSRRSTATTRRPSSSGQRRRHRRAARLHRRLQQHLDLEARLRLHLGLPPRRTTTARRRSTPAASRCSATSTSTATALARPNTILIDSEQLESGEALDKDFREMAADEIEQFRREIVERTGDAQRRREHHRRGPAARGHEHRRQARASSASRSAASSPCRC